MKYIKLLLIAASCILITGCGKDNLRCIKKEDNETGSSTYNITMNFNNRKLVTAKIESVFIINDDYKEYFSVIRDEFNSVLKNYEGKNGIKTEIDSSVTDIKTIVKFNLNKMSEEDKKSMGFDSKGSKKSIKTFYEKDGFKCK